MANQSICLSRIPKKQHALSVPMNILCCTHKMAVYECDGGKRQTFIPFAEPFSGRKKIGEYMLHFCCCCCWMLMQRVRCTCEQITGRCPVGIATLYSSTHTSTAHTHTESYETFWQLVDRCACVSWKILKNELKWSLQWGKCIQVKAAWRANQ